MLRFILLCSTSIVLFSSEITLEDLSSKPSGRVKNFMIWQFLRQDITPQEADKAYAMVEGNVYKVKKQYLKKSKNKEILEKKKCRNERDLLSIKDEECFNMALSPYKTLHLDEDTRSKVLEKVQNTAKKDQIKIQAESYDEKSYAKYSPNTILSMFISTTSKHRRKNLDLKLSKRFVQRIFSNEASNWRKFAIVKIIVNDDNLVNLQKSILHVNPNTVDAKTNFLLGINQLRHGHNQRAVKHFKVSAKKSKLRIDKDKSYFWAYQATKKKSFLRKMFAHMDINIYSLYAHEILNVEVDNYFYSTDIAQTSSDMDITDPFVWSDLMDDVKSASKKNIFDLIEKYNHQDMVSVHAVLIQKAYDYKIHGYILPYEEHLKNVDNDTKALVYALMRQESQLVPSALSRSFALGLMQIMPFVTDHLSKDIENPIQTYNDMFKPSYNIRYGLKHLNWLKKTFYHPLFVAYAYNGGIGFFRKHLKAKTFQEGKFEPFLSMELMSNRESREYGKRVLANYVMYKKILGEEVSIVTLLETLTDQKKTDRYRSKG